MQMMMHDLRENDQSNRPEAAVAAVVLTCKCNMPSAYVSPNMRLESPSPNIIGL